MQKGVNPQIIEVKVGILGLISEIKWGRMANNTLKSFQNLVIYGVYVRAYGSQGKFIEVENDLQRIKNLGVDVIWFNPIHPIGVKNKKGELGCPYSISDYRKVNPEYGSPEDFQRLINKAHKMGLKVMIDIVFNHTAHDAILLQEHPEFYTQDQNGNPITTVPEWSDVIDLRHPQAGLNRYLIDSLKIWVQMGVDGFRCDVASLVPLSFWLQAREEIAQIKPDCIWLAESVHAGFVEYRRRKGLFALSDAELYQAFDITYDYDIWTVFQAAVTGKCSLTDYIQMLRFQDAIYPSNYIKMRAVENHDQQRIMRLASTESQARAWTAFMAFNKGAFHIYNGQEAAETHTPSLFYSDKIHWNDRKLESFLSTLAKLKKHPAQMDGVFTICDCFPLIVAIWVHPTTSLVGFFNLNQQSGTIKTDFKKSTLLDLISGQAVTIHEGGEMSIPRDACIFETGGMQVPDPCKTTLLDFHLERDSE